MSSEVYIQTIRKSNGCPYERIFLGGTALANKIKRDNKNLEPTVYGCFVFMLVNNYELEILLRSYEELTSAQARPIDLEDYPGDKDDFYYWLVIEE